MLDSFYRKAVTEALDTANKCDEEIAVALVQQRVQPNAIRAEAIRALQSMRNVAIEEAQRLIEEAGIKP